jgi:ABC-type Mn2+/Zn2+ transport system permease subunit
MTNQLFFTFVSAIFISGVAGYLGTLMLSRKMSVVSGPLSHLALPGVALAIIYGFSIFAGAFPFVLSGAVLIWLLEKNTKLPMENLAAIIFAFGMGTGLLILPIGKAEEALVGNIGKITSTETGIVFLLSLIIFLLIKHIYQKVIMLNVSEDLASVSGINVKLYDLLYLLSIAVVVSLSVYLVGGLITVALIAIPAAVAKNISRNMLEYKVSASIAGIFSALVGILIANFWNLPIGPIIILVNVGLFLLSVFFKIIRTKQITQKV